MQIEEIKALNVELISAPNSILFLWVTFPRLPEGLETIKAWGFKYKGLAFNWIKTNKNADTLFWGMGYYTRQNSEVCLIGVRGKVPALAKNVHSVIREPYQGHSKKPDIIKDKIIEIVGDVPRIELFARQKTKGWDVWGNEVESDIQL